MLSFMDVRPKALHKRHTKLSRWDQSVLMLWSWETYQDGWNEYRTIQLQSLVDFLMCALRRKEGGRHRKASKIVQRTISRYLWGNSYTARALVQDDSAWRPFTHHAAKEYEASKTFGRRKAASGQAPDLAIEALPPTVKAPDLADHVACPPCRGVGISGSDCRTSPDFTIGRRWYFLLTTNDYLLVKNKSILKHIMLGVRIETKKKEGEEVWRCSTMSKHKDILKASE